MKEKIKALSVSSRKGGPKSRASCVEFVEGQGIKGDAHASGGKRQVSLLFEDSLLKMKKEGIEVSAGDMAENILLTGKAPGNIKEGDLLRINSAKFRVSYIGKKCADMCSIGKKLGKCAMSDEGVFLEVVSGGSAKEGDTAVL